MSRTPRRHLLPGREGLESDLQIEIEWLRGDGRDFALLHDGEPLRSRLDAYRINAKALSPGYLYVFQVDAMGKVDWLFPRNETSSTSRGSNPLKLGQSIRVPPTEVGKALELDTTVGIEHIYAVFSTTRWPRLEAGTGPFA